MAATSVDQDDDPEQVQSVTANGLFNNYLLFDRHSEWKPYKCLLCRKKFRTFLGFKRHLRVHGKECPVCRKLFPSEREQKKHMKDHVSARGYKCPSCPKTFPTLHSYWGHNKSHASVINKQGVRLSPDVLPEVRKGFKQCKKCGKTVAQAHYPAHMNLHRRVRPFKCPHCPKAYFSQSNLGRHKRNYHGMEGSNKVPSSVTDPILEPVSDPVSASSTVKMVVSIPIQVSVASHAVEDRDKYGSALPPVADGRVPEQRSPSAHGDKPFSCSLCGRAYSSKQALRRHHKVKHSSLDRGASVAPLPDSHGSSPPSDVACDILTSRCHASQRSPVPQLSPPSSESEFNDSRLTYPCGCCDAILYSVEAYKTHIFGHTDSICYLCTVCGRRYTSARILWVHQRRIHTQYRRKMLCRTAGGVSELLKLSELHRRSRKTCKKGKSPRGRLLSCHMCSKQFASASYLGRHLRVAHDAVDPNAIYRVCEATSSPDSAPPSPATTDSALPSPVTTDSAPPSPVTTGPAPPSPVTTDSAPPSPVTTDTAPSSPVVTDSAPPSPASTGPIIDMTNIQPLIVRYANRSGWGYKCIFCGRILSRPTLYRSHLNLHTGRCPHTCKLCGESFPNHSQKDRHVIRVHSRHSKKSSPRQTAKKQVTHSSHMLSREMQHSPLLEQSEEEEEDTVRDDVLTATTSSYTVTRDTSALEMATPHSPPTGLDSQTDTSFSCGVCGASMQHYSSYMDHMTQHPTSPPPPAPTTGAVDLWNHVKYMHRSLRRSKKAVGGGGGGSKRYVCQQCGMRYKRVWELKKHIHFNHPRPHSMRLRRMEQPVPVSSASSKTIAESANAMCDERDRELEREEVQPVGGVGPCKVLPVCGEVLVEGEGKGPHIHRATDSQHSDTVLKKYGPWNVIFFKNSTT